MVTQKNFLEYLPGLKPAAFDEDLKLLHFFVMESTEMGTNWAAYSEPEVRPLVDQYFQKLNVFLGKESGNKRDSDTVVPKVKQVKANKVKGVETSRKEERPPQRVVQTKPPTQRHTKPRQRTEVDEQEFSLTERIPEEIRFIRRYVSMQNKKKTKHDLLLFINALHRVMAEKRIRKTSPYAKQVLYIQEKLVKTYNTMKRTIVIEIPEKVYADLKELVHLEKVYPSVLLLKRYVNLNGKYGVKDKAKVLLAAMKRAFEKGHITKSDKYYKLFDHMHANLNRYVKSKNQKILSIVEPELNGIASVVGSAESVSAGELDPSSDADDLGKLYESGEDQAKPTVVMSSLDFQQMKFRTLGFTGKYRELIGDPSPGFTAMVFGRPKMGKSYLCIDFAGYLARNHGRVLYVAKEEGLDYTLQEKLRANDIAHPNLDVAQTLPEDLTGYDFIFLDSVNSLGLSNSDLVALQEHHPGVSFIYVFQTTKTGSHRGDNESQHNVDVVIQVPEKGLAVQNGRFNQGGILRIFEKDEDQTL